MPDKEALDVPDRDRKSAFMYKVSMPFHSINYILTHMPFLVYHENTGHAHTRQGWFKQAQEEEVPLLRRPSPQHKGGIQEKGHPSLPRNNGGVDGVA